MQASILLSTYNQPRFLELVLAGLTCQSTENFEIIICDDGSDKTTKNVIDQFYPFFKSRLFHLWQDDHGFRKAKILNEGIKIAKHPLLIFLDGDCIPHPKFVEDHLALTSEHHYVAGRRVELGPWISLRLNAKSIKKGYFNYLKWDILLSFITQESDSFFRSLRITASWIRKFLKLNEIIDLKGCNFSVLKKHILAINGFDEMYEGYGREDTDVELRLKNLGLSIKSARGLCIQYHLFHERRSFTPINDNLLQKLSSSKRTIAEKGIKK